MPQSAEERTALQEPKIRRYPDCHSVYCADRAAGGLSDSNAGASLCPAGGGRPSGFFTVHHCVCLWEEPHITVISSLCPLSGEYGSLSHSYSGRRKGKSGRRDPRSARKVCFPDRNASVRNSQCRVVQNRRSQEHSASSDLYSGVLPGDGRRYHKADFRRHSAKSFSRENGKSRPPDPLCRRNRFQGSRGGCDHSEAVIR